MYWDHKHNQTNKQKERKKEKDHGEKKEGRTERKRGKENRKERKNDTNLVFNSQVSKISLPETTYDSETLKLKEGMQMVQNAFVLLLLIKGQKTLLSPVLIIWSTANVLKSEFYNNLCVSHSRYMADCSQQGESSWGVRLKKKKNVSVTSVINKLTSIYRLCFLKYWVTN